MVSRCRRCGEIAEGETSCSGCGSRDLRPLRSDELAHWRALAGDEAGDRRRAVMVRCALEE